MRVAIFTDNDFDKVNGVTTTLRAVVEHAPEDIDARIYTCDADELETGDYLSLGAVGFGIPLYRETKLEPRALQHRWDAVRHHGGQLCRSRHAVDSWSGVVQGPRS